MSDRGLAEVLLRPRSVAVLGASADPAKIGGRPVRYCLEAGYTGDLYPVNPTRTEVQGLRAYADIASVPVVPDLALVALPQPAVPDAIEQCLRRGVGAIAVLSAGFAEFDDAGARLQARLADRVRAAGSRLLGPNTNGVFSTPEGLYALFSPVLDRGRPDDGDVAVVTQSAAVGTSLLDLMRRRGHGLRHWVHVGNEADITLLEMARALVDEPDVSTLVVAFENLRRPDELDEFTAAARAAGVRIVAFPTGFSAAARAAAASHTGALTTTSPALTRDLLLQDGATVVSSFRGAVDALEPRVSPSPHPRVAILTTSGGLGVLAADVVAGTDARLPLLSERLQSQLRELAPYCHPANPVDTTAQVINDRDAYGRICSALAASGEFDVVVAFLPHPSLDDALTRQLIDVSTEQAGRCRFVALGPVDGVTASALRRRAVPTCEEPEGLVRHLTPVAGARRSWTQPPASQLQAHVPAVDGVAVDGIVPELAAKRLIADVGIDVVEDVRVIDPEGAVKAAADLGGPVAVKLMAPGVSHKAAIGGVRLDLQGDDAVRQAARDLLSLARAPEAAGAASLLVEPMVTGVEAFLGVSRNSDFGTIAVIGLGGTDVEESSDVAYARLPASVDDIGALVERSGLLAQVGLAIAPRLVGELHAACAALGSWFERLPGELRAVDVNPLVVQADGHCLAVDALVEVDVEPSGRDTEGG